MPRDLTDLMERATAFAPPEPHTAADVTSLAAVSLRRRRAGLAGAVALAVVVAGGLGYGVTRGHDTEPEPGAGYRHGVTVGLSAAVPASSLPGYQAEPWTNPAIQHFSSEIGPLSTYRSVDADGRLIVQRRAGDHPLGRIQVQLYDRPGASPRTVQSPPSPGSDAGHAISWVPSFTDDGRLIWAPDMPITNDARSGFHVTDLDGGHDVFVHSVFRVGQTSFGGTPSPDVSSSGVGTGAPGWGMFGQQYWFASYDHSLPHLTGVAYTLYRATFAGTLTKVAGDVAVMGANDGRVAWITTHGEVMTETTDDPTAHQVPVPLSPGCRIPIARDVQAGLGTFAVDDAVIAMDEQCGTGRNSTEELLAFDPSGTLLVHLTGATTVELSLTPDAILGASLATKTSEEDVVRYDLSTGRLASLGTVSQNAPSPLGAGDYVLWYDTKGGHVARVPD